jgi:hypothetical protein
VSRNTGSSAARRLAASSREAKGRTSAPVQKGLATSLAEMLTVACRFWQQGESAQPFGGSGLRSRCWVCIGQSLGMPSSATVVAVGSVATAEKAHRLAAPSHAKMEIATTSSRRKFPERQHTTAIVNAPVVHAKSFREISMLRSNLGITHIRRSDRGSRLPLSRS